MVDICLCFTIHEPYFLRRYTIFDVKENSIYEDDDRSCNHMISLAKNSYLPMMEILYNHCRHYPEFHFALTVSSPAIDLFEQYTPEVLVGLRALAKTGCVEFITETAPHSLAFLYSKEEFIRQVRSQNERLEKEFGQKPVTFRHMELLYNNELAKAVEGLGLKNILAEGNRHVLGWRNTNYVYTSQVAPDVNILLRNKQLSSDLSDRFSRRDWNEWPLTAEKFASWCTKMGDVDCINVFTDFHVFGLRNPADSGIFDFMRALPQAIFNCKNLKFATPNEVVKDCKSKDSLDVPEYISWRDEGCDIRGWLGNAMQHDAITTIYGLAPRVRALRDPELTAIFERLQTSDYFHHMSTRWFSESQPDRPSPFLSPYDAYITYMNILEDFQWRLTIAADPSKNEAKAKLEAETKGATQPETKIREATAPTSQPEAKAKEAPHKIIFKTSTKHAPTKATETPTETKTTEPAAPKKTTTKPKSKGLPKKTTTAPKTPKTTKTTKKKS